jgi:hypothetical protein
MAKHEMDPGTTYPPATEEYSLTGDALRNSDVQGGGVGTSPAPAHGMRRYPTEQPEEVPAGQPRASRTLLWSAASAVAGAAATLIGMRLARRR